MSVDDMLVSALLPIFRKGADGKGALGLRASECRALLAALERAERVEKALTTASVRGIEGNPVPFERWWHNYSLGRANTREQGIGEDAWVAACEFARAALAATPGEGS
jgi:hypothetical protein